MRTPNLFFNFFRENLKRATWLICVAIFFYGIYIMDFAMAQHRIYFVYGDDYFGPANKTIFWITVLMGILSALQGFGFLFSEKKNLFFQALPLKKGSLFWNTYLTGAIINMSLCGISWIASYWIQEERDMTAVYSLFMGNAISILGFLFVYTFSIIIIVLVGKLFISMVGIGLMFSYGVLVIGFLIEKYSSAFFSSFYKINVMEQMKIYLSPIGLYTGLTGINEYLDLGEWSLTHRWEYLIAILAATIIGSMAAFIFFKKRPIETAGNVLVFKKSEMVIKYVICIPGSLLVGYFFMLCSISQRSFLLLSIGILIGAFALNSLSEVIYHMDIRMMLKNYKSGILILGVCMAVATGFYFDIGGYDAYFPKESEVESVAISVKGIDDDSYWDSADTEDSNAESRMERMRLEGTTKTKVLHWLENVQEQNMNPTGPPITYVRAAFHDAAKGTVYRKYCLTDKKLLEAFHEVYQSTDYKAQTIPLAEYTHTARNNFIWSNGVETYRLNLSEDENNKLLNCYKQDLEKLTFERIKQENSIGTLTLVRSNSMGGSTGYIYPSFHQTIDFLKALSIPAEKSVKDYTIQGLQIAYKNKMGEPKLKNITSVTEINNLKNKLVWEDCAVNPVINPMGEEVIVKYVNAENQNAYDFVPCRLERD